MKKNFFFSRGDLEGRGSQGEVGGDMWSPGSSIQEILEDQYCEERKETSKEMRKWREKIHVYMVIGNVSCFSITFPSNCVCHCLSTVFMD